MRAKIISIEKYPSRHGGVFYYVFFSDMAGHSYRTCLYPACRNWQRWRVVVEKFNQGCEIWLDGLKLKKEGLVDADSPFFYYRTVYSQRVG